MTIQYPLSVYYLISKGMLVLFLLDINITCIQKNRYGILVYINIIILAGVGVGVSVVMYM